MMTSLQHLRAGLAGSRRWTPARRLGQAQARPLVEHLVGRMSAQTQDTVKTLGGLAAGVVPVAVAKPETMEPVFWSVFGVGALTWILTPENRLGLGIVGGSTGTYVLRKLNVL